MKSCLTQQGWAMPIVMVASFLMLWMLLPLWSQVIQATPVAVLQGRYQQLNDAAQVVLTRGLKDIIRPYDQGAFERRQHAAMRWMPPGDTALLGLTPGIEGVMPPCDGQRLTAQAWLGVNWSVTGCLQVLLLMHEAQPWVLVSLRLEDPDTGLTRYWQRVAYAEPSDTLSEGASSFEHMTYHYQAACTSVAVRCAGWP